MRGGGVPVRVRCLIVPAQTAAAADIRAAEVAHSQSSGTGDPLAAEPLYGQAGA